MNWVKDYIGIEYGDRGRKDKLDCWGLVMRVYNNELGIELPSFDEYDSSEKIHSVAPVLDQHRKEEMWQEIPEGEEKPFDIAVFRISKYPVHTGIVWEKGKMLHVEKGINACITPYNGLRWKQRLMGFYRHKEASYA